MKQLAITGVKIVTKCLWKKCAFTFYYILRCVLQKFIVNQIYTKFKTRGYYCNAKLCIFYHIIITAKNFVIKKHKIFDIDNCKAYYLN